MGVRLMRVALSAKWAGLPGDARVVLAHMADTALDDDGQPIYWGGRDALVVALYGFLDDDAIQRHWQYKRLERLISTLRKAGAIAQTEMATGHRRARYLLTLEKPPISAPPTSPEKPPTQRGATSGGPAQSSPPNGHQVAPQIATPGGQTEDKHLKTEREAYGARVFSGEPGHEKNGYKHEHSPPAEFETQPTTEAAGERQRCSHPLTLPIERQRGVCSPCYLANLWRAEAAS